MICRRAAATAPPRPTRGPADVTLPRLGRRPTYLLAYTPELPPPARPQAAAWPPPSRPQSQAIRATFAAHPAVQALRGAARRAWAVASAPDGVLPCLLTTAASAAAAHPAVPELVRMAGRTRGLHAVGVALGAQLGASLVVTALLTASCGLALAQLWRRPGPLAAAPGGEAGAPPFSRRSPTSAAHLPQAALGLALAPFAGSLALACSPAGQLALGCGLALTLGLARLRARPHAPSVSGSAAALSACLLCGPVGWAIAAGMAQQAAVALGTAVWSLAVLTLSLSYALAAKVVEQAPTPYFSTGVLAPAALEDYRFEPPAAKAPLGPTGAGGAAAAPKPDPNATIFDVHPDLWALARQLKAEVGPANGPFLGFRGQPVRHLYGPAGGGKTYSTLGFARELGAYYRASDANQLEADSVGELPIAAINAVTLLLEADAFGRANRRPVVVLLDEVDAILPEPGGVQDNARINKALGFTLLVHTLRLLQQGRSYVVLFTATNRYQAYEPFLRLLGQHGGVQLATPSQASKRKVFCAGLRQASVKLRHRYGFAWAPQLDADDAAIDALMRRCAEQGALSARSMANLVQVALDAAVGQAAEHAHLPPARRAQTVHDNVFAAMHAELTSQFEEERRMPAPSAGTAKLLAHDARTMSAREQQHLDRLLHEMGLRDTSAVRILQTLAENLAHEYVKPANAMRLATIKLRLANVVWLTLLHLGRLATDAPEARDHVQVYVPPRMGLSWLPAPSRVMATAARAVRLQLRAKALRHEFWPGRLRPAAPSPSPS